MTTTIKAAFAFPIVSQFGAINIEKKAVDITKRQPSKIESTETHHVLSFDFSYAKSAAKIADKLKQMEGAEVTVG